MTRILGILLAGTAICTVGLLPGTAQETKKAAKAAEIAGGIEGKIKSIDKAKQTLTIITTKEKEETFTVTTDTEMFGPRGGKVRQRLNDDRFREGFEITVVADGAKAKALHLGYAGRVAGSAKAKAAAAGGAVPDAMVKSKSRRLAREAAKGAVVAEATKTKAEAEDADDDDEVPGKIKSFNGRILVVTLANGTNRSFIVPNDLKVMVNGTLSKTGLKDPAVADGHDVTVFLETGGRRVREIHIKTAPLTTKKKAA